MSEKHLNKRTLSKACGIPYTTIDAFYKKGYENAKLSTLKKLAQYFDTTIDYLMREEINDIDYGKVSPYNTSDKSFYPSREAMEVAEAYDKADFKSKNLARQQLDLPPLEPPAVEATVTIDKKQAV